MTGAKCTLAMFVHAYSGGTAEESHLASVRRHEPTWCNDCEPDAMARLTKPILEARPSFSELGSQNPDGQVHALSTSGEIEVEVARAWAPVSL